MRLRSIVHAALAAAVLLTSLAAQAEDPTPPAPAARAEYGAALEAARRHSREQNWARAKGAWLALLDDHAGADYVRADLGEIRLQLRRASFWAQAKKPELASLSSGELVEYEPGTGFLRIRYRWGQLGDFLEGKGPAAGTFVHPAHFRGPWSVRIEGTAAELVAAQWVVRSASKGVGIRFGRREQGAESYSLHTLFEFDGEGSRLLLSAEPKSTTARLARLQAEVAVDVATIRASHEGVQVLQGMRPGDGYGQLLVSAGEAFGIATLEGRVDPGWIDGLLDAAVLDQRRAFDARWVEPAVLARWEGAATPVELSPSHPLSKLRFRMELTDVQQIAHVQLRSQATQGRAQALAVLGILERSKDGELPPEAVASVRLAACLELERHGDALESLAQLTPVEGQELEAALLRAILLGDAARLAESAAELETLARAHPAVREVHLELVVALLRSGRAPEARAAVRRAREALPDEGELGALELQVIKAEAGPAWKERYEYAGLHFVVRSDASIQTCREASRVLDKAMERCVAELGAVPQERRGRSVAYIFSGQASYRDYVEGIADGSMENTRGIYSLLLKQVVAWNEPDSEALWDTLRHECMHRYVDLRVGPVPRWLDEGLAETFAASAQADGTWKPGGLRPAWIELLRSSESPAGAFEDFARQDNQDFLADIERNYARSWAWLHYLRFEGDNEGRAVFGSLWKALVAGKEASLAIDEALAGRDMRALQANFAAYLRKLHAQ